MHTKRRSFASAAFLLVLVSSVASAQAPGRVERERGIAILRQVRADLEKHYHDSTFQGIDVRSRFAEAEQRIAAAASVVEIYGRIAEILMEFDDQHTFFVPPGLTVSVDYGFDMLAVGDTCFVSEVRPGSDAYRQGVRPGDVVLTVNGHAVTRENLWQLMYVYHFLRPQRGLRIEARAPAAPVRLLDVAARVRERKQVLDLTGSDGGADIWDLIRDAEDAQERYGSRVIDAGDGVLILKLRAFSRVEVGDGVKALRNRKSVILDLRGNAGGSVSSLLDLLGHFFTEDVLVGTVRKRSGEELLRVKGKGSAFGGPLVVLVDSRSASAAEIFAHVVQATGRGTVIGDRTAGAVMRGRFTQHRLGGAVVVGYATIITDGDLVLSDGTRLEKRGVHPGTVLLPTSEDLAKERDPVLSHAALRVGVELSPERAWHLTRARGRRR